MAEQRSKLVHRAFPDWTPGDNSRIRVSCLYLCTGTEVGLGAIVLASIRADRRADLAYGWLMRGTGEAQTAMRRMLGFVNISELASALGAPIEFLFAGRLRRVDKSGVQLREPRPIDCVNLQL